MSGSTTLLPLLTWAPDCERTNLRSDVAAGVTVGAMPVPQAMARVAAVKKSDLLGLGTRSWRRW